MLNQINESFQLLVDKLSGWLDAIILALPNIIVALIVFGLSLLLARFIKKLTRRSLRSIKMDSGLKDLIASTITVVFFTLTFILILSILNLEKATTSLLAGAGIVGLAVGLAFQDPIMNTVSGVIMTLRKPYNVGDLVESNGFFGTIREITMRSTNLDSPSGELIVIPNKEIIQNPLKNYSIRGIRRIDIDCGVSYGDNLETAKKIAVQAIENSVDYNKEKPVELFFKEFGDSSINFVLRFWIDLTAQKDYLTVRSDAIIAIKKAFDENGISIPFPIRTLDFDAKGGEKLSDFFEQKKSLND